MEDEKAEYLHKICGNEILSVFSKHKVPPTDGIFILISVLCASFIQICGGNKKELLLDSVADVFDEVEENLNILKVKK